MLHDGGVANWMFSDCARQDAIAEQAGRRGSHLRAIGGTDVVGVTLYGLVLHCKCAHNPPQASHHRD
jgi:hypothetical protein